MIVAIAGLIAGSVHVLSGPDHLAAVAPLATRGRKEAWRSGLRWGLGHASGVVVVGMVALLLRGLLPLAWLTSVGERLVGVVLVAIGLWGMRAALGTRVHTHEHEHGGSAHVHAHVHAPGRVHAHTHAAFAVGVIHGLAGSAHFLGVLPALALPTRAEAILYLVAFGSGTIATMTLFASAVGTVAARMSSSRTAVAYRAWLGVCSAVAIVVGVVWLGAAH